MIPQSRVLEIDRDRVAGWISKIEQEIARLAEKLPALKAELEDIEKRLAEAERQEEISKGSRV